MFKIQHLRTDGHRANIFTHEKLLRLNSIKTYKHAF